MSDDAPAAAPPPTPSPSPHAVTVILHRIKAGDDRAAGELMPLVYDELRRKARFYMAREKAGHTLQATALVHDAFLRLVGDGVSWDSSRHFFNAAAEVMRQLLVDHARRRSSLKRGGQGRRVGLEGLEVAAPGAGTSLAVDSVDWEALDRAMAALKAEDERRYQVVMLRYFAGLPEHEVAQCLGVSPRTVIRDWKTARMFLLSLMKDHSPGGATEAP
jgi:RNA polymerase sigma factor (TIGR02999 family)